MTYIAKPKFHHPALPKNALGYTHRDYEGKISTLCAGCGHDSITAAIIEACFELSIEPHRVAKISGIGCSSKTPDYFLGDSHGFNSVHGRMPSVLTGANLANRDLIYLGVSGDGDSASIGLGQFAHAMRRGVNMVYIVENNGVYGLTKGQFSATADRGSKSKRGVTNNDNSIDLVAMALQLGATFVARSFSGDKDQLVPLIKAAIEHQGAAFIDVISPCVAFNNHAGSTKSFDYVREHNEAVNRLDFITARAPITVAYEPGRGRGGRAARRLEARAQEGRRRLRCARPARRHELPAAARRQGPDRDRAALCRPRARGPAPPLQHGRGAAQLARREGAVPRLGGAGEDQRGACGTRNPPSVSISTEPGLSPSDHRQRAMAAHLAWRANRVGEPSRPQRRGRLARPFRHAIAIRVLRACASDSIGAAAHRRQPARPQPDCAGSACASPCVSRGVLITPGGGACCPSGPLMMGGCGGGGSGAGMRFSSPSGGGGTAQRPPDRRRAQGAASTTAMMRVHGRPPCRLCPPVR